MNIISMSRIKFTIVRTCMNRYYTQAKECDTLCLPSHNYTCDGTGRKVCNKG